MQFTYPAFLFGLLTLAIPVIIHLFHLKRYKKVHFSNVQFLRNIQQSQSSRKKLKRRIILLMRMLALAFLVFAFAKPYIPAKGNADDLNSQKIISIFVDNSYSMGTINREGTLLSEACSRAKELASGYNLNDRFQLLTQDFKGAHQRLLSRKEFIDEVDKIKVSPQSHTLQQIIDRQQGFLKLQSTSAKNIFIISDFQKNLLPSPDLKMDTSISIRFVQLKATTLPNLTVDSAWFESAVHSPGANEKLIVKLHNYADKKAEKIPLKLIVNGVQKALGSYTIDARSAQIDTLSFSGLQAGWQSAQIQLQDNPITFDNRFNLTFKVEKQIPVLLIDGGEPNKFLTAVFNSDSFFKAEAVHYGNVDYARLATYPFIVLTDVKSIPAGLSQQLNLYVKNGGTLTVFPADAADITSYQVLLQPMGANYPEALLTNMGRVTDINLQSQVFKDVFDQMPQNPDLPMVLKYYRLSSNSRISGENLMNLPGKQPFLANYNSGKGQVYVFAVPLRDDYSNLPHHALLVPLMFRMALLSGHVQPLFYTIGQDESIEVAPILSSDRDIIKLIKPGQVILPDMRQKDGGTLLYFSDQVQEPGNYNLMKQDSILARLAFNNSRSESDLNYLTEKELKASMPVNDNLLVISGLQPSKSITAKTNMGPELWKLCLILSLIFLVSEILLIRYYKPETPVSEVPA